jgi:N-acetylglucosamine-6-phosphate deacetylase
MKQTLFFRNADLFTAGGVILRGSLLVEDGKIQAVGEAGTLRRPDSAGEVDLEGLILAPGYIDVQINGAFGLDFTARPESIETVAAGLPVYGVTAFLPTIITSPSDRVSAVLEAWEQVSSQEIYGATPLGLHLEGPMINPLKKGAHNPACIRSPSVEVVEGWIADRGVRLVTLAPELPGAMEVVRELRRRGIRVSAGHTLASYEQAVQSFQNGLMGGTHLFNAMSPLDHRTPGLAVALLLQHSAYAGLIVDGVHVHPAMVELAWQLKKPDHLVLVSDAMAALGMEPGIYHLADDDVTVDEKAARLPDGTLAGSILSMDAAVRNLKSYTGCTLAQATACASTNPAGLLGVKSKGRLAPGMDADLVLLTPQGDVVATLVGGRVLHSKTPVLEVEI